MQNTSIEVNGLHKPYDGQPVLRGVSFAVGGNGIFGRPLLRAQLQASELADRLRVGAALRLADRRRSMFPPGAALYGTRHAQATLGWGADVRLFLGPKWVALRELWYRAAGGF
jgi:hypothetical protein